MTATRALTLAYALARVVRGLAARDIAVAGASAAAGAALLAADGA